MHTISFYKNLLELQETYPNHYKMSGFCKIIHTEPDTYSVVLPSLEYNSKQDDGNANTRDRYMGILLKEFANPVEKTENYRILYNKLYSQYGPQIANEFLLDDVLGVIYKLHWRKRS